MGDASEPVAGDGQKTGTFSHRRLLFEMTAVTLVIGMVGLIAASGSFFAGVLFGGGISVLNFVWLERSTARIFRAAAGGEKPALLAIRYILRYLLIGLILLGVYLTGWVPIVAVILGLASFGFAVLVEGIISIFRNP